MSNEFNKRNKDDYFQMLEESYKTNEIQATLKNIVQYTPEEFRKMLLSQEASVYGIKKDGETYTKANGTIYHSGEWVNGQPKKFGISVA